MKKPAQRLIDLITKIQPDNFWGIWAEKPFTPESAARYGQTQFENGGLLDDAIFFANGIECGDFISEYWEGTPYNKIDNKMRTEAAKDLIIEKEDARIKSTKIINRDLVYQSFDEFEVAVLNMGNSIPDEFGFSHLDESDQEEILQDLREWFSYSANHAEYNHCTWELYEGDTCLNHFPITF